MPASSDLELLVLQALTSRKIVEAIEHSKAEHPLSFPLSTRLKDNKTLLVHRLFGEGAYWQNVLVEMAEQSNAQKASKDDTRRARATELKRNSRRTARTREEQARTAEQATPAGSEFLEVPSESDMFTRYKAFYDATSNEALQTQVCAVCARLLNSRAAQITTLPLDMLPNAHRLRPATAHEAHTLIDGYLLAEPGCTHDGNSWLVNVCNECHAELKKDIPTPPKFSLANGLCVGEIPRELAHLTLAEQLLIARVYPRVLVVKLFPKSRAARHGLEEDQLQGALRGNVTSFELNSDAIADMISGNLMPQKPEVLASVLSVTFIGRGKTPSPAALRLFRVRRDILASALKWLHDHNPKYYGDIKIDQSRLDLLPEDGVPREVLINMRQELDDSILNAESNGYVPEYDDEESDQVPLPSSDDNDEESTDPDVVPLQYLGVMDNDLTKISTSDIMASGLLNLGRHGDEGGYAVRYGAPVNTFGQPPAGAPPPDPNRPNYWERAFPTLYPSGIGGIERDRPVPLSFIEHVRWSLQHYDRRFRLHATFIFVAFAIYQRRQIFASTRIQMKRRNFDAIARTLSTITPQDLQTAAEEEDQGRAHSNPSIAVLKRYVNATSSRVMGSDAARYQLRSQIWSTSVALNPPTIWMTINPDDIHDPIAQIFAGEEIDMDHFVQTAGPDKNQRSRNIARDPYAAAEFFNFLVTVILEKLLGIRATSSRVHSDGGVLGKIKAYFGTVECQGRGTLHLHMLAWLEDAPSPDRLKELLRTPEFKSRVVAYLQANVRAFLPHLANEGHLHTVQPDPEIGYSRFPDPTTPTDTFHQALSTLETKVVRTKQMHSCSFGRCLNLKHGRLVCKRRAPFEISSTDSVDDDGTYRVKRSLGYLNNFCPAITVTAKCNNDIKLLLHGAGTNNITFYVTGYIAKKQGKSHNTSSLLAKNLLYHFESTDYFDNLRERQRILLFRAVNVLNREQEVPAPLAVSYLMGWGDVYRSHHYAPVYWGSFVSEIYKTYPNLRYERQSTRTPSAESASTSEETAELPATEHREVEGGDDELDSEAIVLSFNRDGQLHFRSQVEDYAHRGTLLEHYNVYDFLAGTYEKRSHPQSSNMPSPEDSGEPEHDGEDNEQGDNEPSVRRRGRPTHTRVSYLPPHPSHKSHVRVVRPADHNTLPNFIGPRLPRCNDPDQTEFYSASVLTMLKPWRSLADLKQPGQSWASALEVFVASSSQRIRDIISSLDHYYACKTAAEDDAKKIPTVNEDEESGATHKDEDEEMEPPESEATEQRHVLTNAQITPEMIAQARAEAAGSRNLGYGREAVEIGRAKGVFAGPRVPVKPTITRGTSIDTDRLAYWQKLLQQSLQAAAGTDDLDSIHKDQGGVSRMEDMSSGSSTIVSTLGSVTGLLTQNALDPATVDELFTEQRRAFNIMRRHLAQTLEAIHTNGPPPPQLMMLLVGEGGTGKSKVIQTITTEFERRGVAGMLIKSAFTGIAATLIQGKTTHQIGCISVNRKELSPQGKAKLAQMWKDVRYLIIDECSMLSKTFFRQLSEHIQIGKLAHDPSAEGKSFGGVNVVVCGDEHQFPPVAGGAPSALYHPTSSNDSTEARLGREIFEEFETVVILRKQVRVSDDGWRTFLTSLRNGRVQHRQIDMLRTLVLTNPTCIPTDFESDDTWRNVSLVTPRHVVRNQWNEAAVMKHCQSTGHQLFVCPANDTIKKRPLSMLEQYVAAQANPSEKPGGLPDSVMLAVGMKVMVTLNVDTDLDIANGARGEIVDIVLDPNEPPFEPTSPVVTLTHLPAYVLVKMARHTRTITLPNLEPGVIPIVPAAKTFKIKMDVEKNGQVVRSTRTIRRLQFPITPAYAFTDYRSQGQTIDSVIVDITTPPSGKKLTQFNAYVALSRSSGRKTIRILRDFDEALLMQPVDPDLADEDDRLEELDARTKTWYDQVEAMSGGW